MIFFYTFRVRWKSIKGSIVVVDRYFWDNIIDMETDSNSEKLNRFIYRIVHKIIPKPDLQYILIVSEDTIKSRGCDDTLNVLAQKRKLFEKVITENNNFQIINNEESCQSVSALIIHKALTAFYNKYPDKYNGYQIRSFRYK